MEAVEKMEISTEVSETPAEDAETQLITYLQNILKCQIVPMNFMSLRELVAEAPKKMKLREYVEDKYPDEHFLDFLRKYPNIFILNADKTVILAEGNSFTLPFKTNTHQQSNRSFDEVDGSDKKEYISNSESSDDDDEALPLNEERRQLVEIEDNSDTVDTDGRRRAVSESSTSSISDSSVDLFSSEIVQTSDSMANDSIASSLSSNSSLDN